MESYLESKRRDTGGDANSARVGRETAETPHLKTEPVSIQTSPFIEPNRCAQRKTPKQMSSGQERFSSLARLSVPRPAQSQHPSMSSAPSPYNSNAAWSTNHYSRSSPAHPSQQTKGPKSGMSADEDEDESDENNETVEDVPEQNRLSQLKGLFLKDCKAFAPSTNLILILFYFIF